MIYRTPRRLYIEFTPMYTVTYARRHGTWYYHQYGFEHQGVKPRLTEKEAVYLLLSQDCGYALTSPIEELVPQWHEAMTHRILKDMFDENGYIKKKKQ